MKKENQQTEETKEDKAILEEIRANSKKEGTIESFIFGMLSTAHPNAIEMIEKQAVMMVKAGRNIGKGLNEVEDDPAAKAKAVAAMHEAASSLRKSVNDLDEEDLNI